MYQSLANSNLVIREWLNGSLFPLTLNLTLIILVFIVDSYLEAKRTKVSWLRMPGMGTATSLFCIFSAESGRALAVWYILRKHNSIGDGIPQSVEYWSDFAFIIAGVALVPALLRCTFIFTPPKWGHWIWVVSAASTIAFLLLSHLLPSH